MDLLGTWDSLITCNSFQANPKRDVVCPSPHYRVLSSVVRHARRHAIRGRALPCRWGHACGHLPAAAAAAASVSACPCSMTMPGRRVVVVAEKGARLCDRSPVTACFTALKCRPHRVVVAEKGGRWSSVWGG
jgi:hypothetical protein